MKYGKCQICERSFRTDQIGRLFKHGHRNDGMHRNNFCPGSYRAPAPAVDALEEQVAKLRGEDAARYAGLIGKYERRIGDLTTRSD